MPSPLFPVASTLPVQNSYSHLYPIASVQEDLKSKARGLSAEAQAELHKAGNAAKGAGIRMYSPQYYAACTVGGLAACVRPLPLHSSPPANDFSRVSPTPPSPPST